MGNPPVPIAGIGKGAKKQPFEIIAIFIPLAKKMADLKLIHGVRALQNPATPPSVTIPVSPEATICHRCRERNPVLAYAL
jgi:hypothetical protein